MADLTGQCIEQRYEIIELLDEGGMAMVYRAYDIRLNRPVALKIISKEKFNKEQLEEILQRFEQESQALAKLSHPNIVPIQDYGEHDGSPYLVLEYLPGGTLRKKMEPHLPWQVAIHVMLPVMDALTYCHQRSILHRDIKPSNILFREDDTPVLADFGIAKLLETAGALPQTGIGVFVGTQGYMAPEQTNSSHNTKLDARTDVYQVGIVLYEAITGHRPFDLANFFETIPHPKDYAPDLPAVFDKIILKALELQPSDRYQTMEDFKTAIQYALSEHPLSSETQGQLPPQPVIKPPKRPDVFLCYTKSDEANVTNLGRALRQDGMKTRPEKKNSNPGVNWQEKLLRDIQKSDAVVVCLTKNSTTRNGMLQPEIKLAMEIAREKSIPVIPARLHEHKIPQALSKIKHVDLFKEGGYPILRSLLAERAKEIGAASPLTGAFYIQPNIVEENRSSIKYIALPALILILIVIAAIFTIYPPFRKVFLQVSPTKSMTATSTIATTGPATSTPIPPGVDVYRLEIIDQSGTKMRLVKAGKFIMGYSAEEALSECRKYSSNCLLNQFLPAEPAGTVNLASYYIDRYEVTNSAYQKCVEEKKCQQPKKTGSSNRIKYYGTPEFALYPVIYVDWDMAKTYCEWRGARLPTEAEWEKAARGTEGYLFPWGNTLEGMMVNFCDKDCRLGLANKNMVDGYPDTAPVFALSSGVSTDLVFNMAGNVWEWVSSLYAPYPYDPGDGRENLREPGETRVARGGSWRDDVSSIFSITRNGYHPSTANEIIGFRCAKTP